MTKKMMQRETSDIWIWPPKISILLSSFVDKSCCSMSRIVKELRWEVEVALCFLLPGQSWTLIEGHIRTKARIATFKCPILQCWTCFASVLPALSYVHASHLLQNLRMALFCTALAFSKSDFSVLESHFESTRTTWKTTATSIDRALVFVQPNSGESHLSFFKSYIYNFNIPYIGDKLIPPFKRESL